MEHWTEHSSYQEMSILTMVSGHKSCNDEMKERIQMHCDAIFMEMWEEGVDCEGWEPSENKNYLRMW